MRATASDGWPSGVHAKAASNLKRLSYDSVPAGTPRETVRQKIARLLEMELITKNGPHRATPSPPSRFSTLGLITTSGYLTICSPPPPRSALLYKGFNRAMTAAQRITRLAGGKSPNPMKTSQTIDYYWFMAKLNGYLSVETRCDNGGGHRLSSIWVWRRPSPFLTLATGSQGSELTRG